jgi:hypothetical protein
MGDPKLSATFPQLHLVVSRGCRKVLDQDMSRPRDNDPLIALALPVAAITGDIVPAGAWWRVPAWAAASAPGS